MRDRKAEAEGDEGYLKNGVGTDFFNINGGFPIQHEI
jgi:hypothetical protein